jgi:hypothetical protein
MDASDWFAITNTVNKLLHCMLARALWLLAPVFTESRITNSVNKLLHRTLARARRLPRFCLLNCATPLHPGMDGELGDLFASLFTENGRLPFGSVGSPAPAAHIDYSPKGTCDVVATGTHVVGRAGLSEFCTGSMCCMAPCKTGSRTHDRPAPSLLGRPALRVKRNHRCVWGRRGYELLVLDSGGWR